MKKKTIELTQYCLAAIAGFTKSYDWQTIDIGTKMVSLGFSSGTAGDLACRQLRRALQNHAEKYQGSIKLTIITKKDTTVKAVLISIIDACGLRENNESDSDIENAIKQFQRSTE